MPRYMFRLKVRPEFRKEYIEIHKNVDRALIEKYEKCGVRNYSIFISGDSEVLGYLEVPDWTKFADAVSNSPEQKAWAKKVEKFFTIQPSAPGGMEMLSELFHMD